MSCKKKLWIHVEKTGTSHNLPYKKNVAKEELKNFSSTYHFSLEKSHITVTSAGFN